MKNILLILTTLLAVPFFLAAEEQHIIDHFIIKIDGSTKERALLREMDIKDGQFFSSYEELEWAVSEQKQELINTRVFNKVEMNLEKISTEGDLHSYAVSVKLEDTWTIIPFPYPKYDSNTGFRVGMKFFYDNALGSLNNFFLGTNVDLKINDESGKLEPGNWTFNPQLNDVKIGDKEYGFNYMIQYSENIKEDADGTVLEEHNYYNSDFSIGTKYDLGNNYYYRINPSIGFNFGDTGTNYEREPYYLSFSHTSGYSNVDWIKNFREGYSFSANNGISYVYKPDGDDKIKFTVGADGRYYKILNKRLNYTSSLSTIFSFNDELTGLGSNLRGISNNSMYGIAGAFMSHDLTIGVIQWEGVGEAQFQPFFDMGITKRESDFDRDQDFRYGTGADFILYLDKLNSLHARGTLAVDLSNDLSFSDFDKYEIIITSSLSY